MDKRYGKKGLRILAPEVQGSPVDSIEALVKKHKIEYPIMKGTTRPDGMRGIPHSVVFDAEGELIFQGHPADPEFDKTIKKALRDVKEEEEEEDSFFSKPAEPVIAEREWTNAEGKTITAAVLSIDGETVKFKLKNGRETNYPVAKLSEEDQEFLKEKASESAGDED